MKFKPQNYHVNPKNDILYHQQNINNISSIYPNDYYQPARGLTKLLTNSLEAISYFHRKLLIKSIFQNKKISILDVGCGNQNFLCSLPNYYQRTGIDIHPNSHKTIETIKSDYNKYRFSNKFDVITMWHSLEHFPIQSSILKKIYQDLKPHGIVLITTPNTDSLGYKLGRSNWFHLDFPRHFTLYNADNLKQTLAKYKFRVIKQTYPFYEYPLDLFKSIKNHPIRFLIYPLYPLFKLFSNETQLVIAQKD